jgi:hypothetical protein
LHILSRRYTPRPFQNTSPAPLVFVERETLETEILAKTGLRPLAFGVYLVPAIRTIAASRRRAKSSKVSKASFRESKLVERLNRFRIDEPLRHPIRSDLILREAISRIPTSRSHRSLMRLQIQRLIFSQSRGSQDGEEEHDDQRAQDLGFVVSNNVESSEGEEKRICMTADAGFDDAQADKFFAFKKPVKPVKGAASALPSSPVAGDLLDPEDASALYTRHQSSALRFPSPRGSARRMSSNPAITAAR